MNKDVVLIKRDELLSLPNRAWNEVKQYESLIIVPTKHKHDSGWRLMAIIGCNKIDDCHNMPEEIVGYCDDIHVLSPDNSGLNKFPINLIGLFQCDMLLSNCIRFHSNYCNFEVGCCLSSTDVKLIVNANKYINE